MNDWPPGVRIRPIEHWPGELTKSRRTSPFFARWYDTLALLARELKMMNARNVVLQVAIPEGAFRIDGYPRAAARADHPGVILALDSPLGSLSWPCDTFTTWQDNIRAIALSMEALRKMDRYGVTKRGEQYTGWLAIEAPKSGMNRQTAIDTILQYCDVGVGLSDQERYRVARHATHPDRHGGDREAWDKVEEAAKVLGLLT